MTSPVRPIVTLLTDFGDRLGYVGQVKGVLLSMVPDIELIDLSHAVEPQAILEAEMILGQSYAYFPVYSIHLAVVDPGVGGERQGVVIRSGRTTFIGPDNGLFGFLQRDGLTYEAYALENETYRRRDPSFTFHGRDIFAPAAAHVALGVNPSEFGPRVEALTVLNASEIEHEGPGLSGQVVALDRFGNLVTSVTAEQVLKLKEAYENQSLTVIMRGESIPLGDTFSSVLPHEMVAYIGSGGRLEIAVNLGHAADTLKVRPGSVFKLKPV